MSADADAARAFGREHEDAVLVGERRGAPRAGFDFVPLPTRLRNADLSGRPVAIRTTNGTRAVDHVDEADRLLVGSTVNARAVAETLAGQTGDSYLVAAGDTDVSAYPRLYAGVERTGGTQLPRFPEINVWAKYTPCVDEFSIEGHEVVEKGVSSHGNGAHVYVPKEWLGETVKIVRTTDNND